MRKFSFNILRLIFILSFITGGLVLVGFNNSYLNLSINFLTIVFILVAFILKKSSFIIPAHKSLFIFLSVIIISFIINRPDLILFIFFIKQFILPILFFYALFNVTFNSYQNSKLFSLVKLLFFIQLPAMLVKFYFYGIQEDIVGVISVEGGSISTILPILAIAYLIPRYYNFKSFSSLVYIILFIAFSLIGAKFAIIYYTILVYFIAIIVLKKNNNFLVWFLKFGKMFLLFLICIILFIKINPRMNPEKSSWGTVNLDYIYTFTTMYSNMNVLSKNDAKAHGRITAFPVIYKILLDKGPVHFLFGNGPGDIIKSEMFDHKDPLLEKYNVGYGGRLGVFFIFIQLGLVGLISFLIFIYSLYKKSSISQINQKYYRSFNVSVTLFFLIFILDFFTYSTILLLNIGMSLVFYFLIYRAISENKIYFQELLEKNIK